jgi:hypothetical protein
VQRALQGTVDSALTQDDILDNISLYWLTNTGVSAARRRNARFVPIPALADQANAREHAAAPP